jgi:hypothetical protein
MKIGNSYLNLYIYPCTQDTLTHLAAFYVMNEAKARTAEIRQTIAIALRLFIYP